VSEAAPLVQAFNLVLLETVSLGDESPALSTGISITPADTVTVADNLTIGFPVDASETITLTENQASTQATSPPLAESLTAVEALDQIQAMDETVSETVPTDESLQISEDIPFAAPIMVDLVEEGAFVYAVAWDNPETVTLTESFDSLQVQATDVAETVTVTEDLAASESVAYDLPETVSLTEDLTATPGVEFTPNDTLNVSDNTSLQQEHTWDISEAVTLSEDFIVSVAHMEDTSDTVTVSDSSTEDYTASPAEEETVALTESFDSLQVQATDVDETITVVDVLALGQAYSVDDGPFNVTENSDQHVDFFPGAVETVIVAEGFQSELDMTADTTDDPVIVFDVASIGFEHGAVVDESLSAVDAVVDTIGVYAPLSESVSVVEALATSQMEGLLDTVTVSDSVITVMHSDQATPEAVTVSDSVFIQQNTGVSASDFMLLVESGAPLYSATLPLFDATVNTTEAANLSQGIAVSGLESVLVSDSVATHRNLGVSATDFVLLAEGGQVSNYSTLPVSDAAVATLDTADVSQGNTVPGLESVAVSEYLSVLRVSAVQAREQVSLIEVMTTDGDISAVAIGPDMAQVVFGTSISLDRVTDASAYHFRPSFGGVPVRIVSVEPTQETKDTGAGGRALNFNQISAPIDLRRLDRSVTEEGTRILIPWVIPPSVGDYLDIEGSRYSFQGLRITSVAILSFNSTDYPTVTVDRKVVTTDPNNGDLAWTVKKAVSSVTVRIDHATKGATYSLDVGGLRSFTGAVFNSSNKLDLVADANGPTFEGYDVDTTTGAVTLTFSRALQIDSHLFNPDLYRIVGPSQVHVVSVSMLSDRQVVIQPTRTFATGSYTLVIPSFKDLSLNRVEP